MDTAKETENTIKRFGEQWLLFKENPGYYGSIEDLQNVLGPLLEIASLKNCNVAEIGSGTGRVVNMLLDADVAAVTAIEPSAAYDVLKINTSARSKRVNYIKARGEEIPQNQSFDYVFSIGVIHHIPEPNPVVRAAFSALKPGGKVLIWVYAREGNRLYLSIVQPLRFITVHLPSCFLNGLVYLLNCFLDLYLLLCRFLPLPMRDYMRNKLGRYSRKVRHMTIYDQLNPTFSKYYRREEIKNLLESAGFQQVNIYHRDGYSWTVIGTRPTAGNL
ncbi:class I SAM-dependent methyltransferase [bacterium]|nr:class I SAM-dependent methyltransferase [bacterium]